MEPLTDEQLARGAASVLHFLDDHVDDFDDMLKERGMDPREVEYVAATLSPEGVGVEIGGYKLADILKVHVLVGAVNGRNHTLDALASIAVKDQFKSMFGRVDDSPLGPILAVMGMRD
jgi:hypothetical protein